MLREAALLRAGRRRGQRSRQGASGTVSPPFRRCGAGAFRACAGGADRRQAGPLVLVQQSPELDDLVAKAADLVFHLVSLTILRQAGRRPTRLNWRHPIWN